MLLVWLVACVPVSDLPPPESVAWTPSSTPAWPLGPGDDLPLPPELAAHPSLESLSTWRQAGTPEGRATAGSYAVGNGLAFGLLGLDHPWGTLTNLTGPHYQRSGGFFGDSAVLPVRDGRVGEWAEERVQQVRNVPVVRAGAEAAGLVLQQTVFAPPGVPAVVRHLSVTADDPLTGAGLAITLATAPDDDVVLADALGQVRGDRTMWVGCPDADAIVVEGRLQVHLPDLAAGDTWSTTCVHAFAAGETWDPEAFGPAGLDPSGLTDVSAALDALEAEHPVPGVAVLVTSDPAVDDFVEGQLRTVLVQTDISGVVSPMSRYTSGWLRDAEGPVRLLLRLGLHERARAILDGTVAALAHREQLSNSFSLHEVDPSALPDDPEQFWSEVPFMPGREAAEAPSYPVLLEAQLARWSGTSIADDRLAFLRACLDRQAFTPEGLLPFSGDETYRYPMAFVLGAEPETLGWSLGSQLLWVAAADALAPFDAGWGERADMARVDLESAFVSDGVLAPLVPFDGSAPPPAYEDLAAMALWLGPDVVDPGVAAETLLAVAATEPPWMSPGAIGTTGMFPGWVVAGLADPHAVARLPADRLNTWSEAEDAAWVALGERATPSGHFEELMTVDGALALVHLPDGTGDDVTARARPWEGGDVAAAVLRRLTGLSVGPATDAGIPVTVAPGAGPAELMLQGFRIGEGRATLSVQHFEEGRTIRLSRDDDGGVPWQLTVWFVDAGSEWRWIWVDGVLRPTQPGAAVSVEWSLAPGASVELVGVR
ncbi:MAG: hypothetical protein ACI8PZ_000469 [Myxococcota bacterium]|jgi:hypothetical protein